MFNYVQYTVKYKDQPPKSLGAIVKGPKHLVEYFLMRHLQQKEKDIVRFKITDMQPIEGKDVVYEWEME